MKRIYLDYAATTPVKEEVLHEMLPLFKEVAFDETIYNKAQRNFEKYIGAESGTVHFNSGGSYANNELIIGLCKWTEQKGKHIITSTIEHPAVYKVFDRLKLEGYEVDYAITDANGVIDFEYFKTLLRKNTAFVSVMWINNELGTKQPIEKIIELCHDNGTLVHVDAVQALGNLAIDVSALDVDAMSFSAHKVYAPKGCGATYIKPGIMLETLIKNCLNPESINLPYIVGFVKGVELAYNNLESNLEKKRKLKKMLIEGLLSLNLGIKPIGQCLDEEQHPQHPQHPGIVNLFYPQMDSDSLIINYNFQGIAISGGSACSSGALSASHVLKAIGLSETDARKCVRMTIGDFTTQEDIMAVIAATKVILKGYSNVR